MVTLIWFSIFWQSLNSRKVTRHFLQFSVNLGTKAHTQLFLKNTVQFSVTLQWRRNGHDGVSNHQLHHCLLNRLFGGRSKKTSKLRVTGLCEGNLLVTGEFPAQMASTAETVSIWWRHHVLSKGATSSLHLFLNWPMQWSIITLSLLFSLNKNRSIMWFINLFIMWFRNLFRNNKIKQVFMMTSSNGNIFRVTGHLCG